VSASSKKNDEKKDDEKQQSGGRRQSGGGGRRRQSQRAQSQENGNNEEQQSRGREARRLEEPRELEPTEVFEPLSAARIATLRMARNWRFGGNPYAAMHAYERILAKWGGTPAAHAAAEELIAMAGELERDGKFYTALNIMNKVEEYFSPFYGDTYERRRPPRYRPRRRPEY
jgi:hypothetical protein